MTKPKTLPQNQASPTSDLRHVAIIMDGNRRWAHAQGLPHIEGHKKAIQRIQEIIEYSVGVGITHVTFWAWSTKNWKRNNEFVSSIIGLFREQLGDGGIFSKALAQGAEIHHIGVLDRFPADIQDKMADFLFRKPINKKIDVNIAVGYEGRDELVRAVRKIVANNTSVDSVTEELVAQSLDTAGQPGVDFLIRTGGEKRTSGFLIWQAADAEYYFTDKYMPDFGVEEYKKALEDYGKRERRMGGDSARY